MFLLHTKLPSFIAQLKNAALRRGKEIPCQVLGLENLTSAKVQSARTGRLENAVEELSQTPGAAQITVQIVPRIPETLHTVIMKVMDGEGKPIRAVLDTVGIIHPAVDCYLEGFDEIEDRRPSIGRH